MSKKHKAMRQGTPIRWDALDRIHKAEKATAAEEARNRMIKHLSEAMSDNPFEEVKEAVTPEMAYQHMTREKAEVSKARNRMLERRKKQSDNNYYAGGIKQTGGANEAREKMIERLEQPNNGSLEQTSANCDSAKQQKKSFAAARNSVYKPKYKRVKK